MTKKHQIICLMDKEGDIQTKSTNQTILTNVFSFTIAGDNTEELIALIQQFTEIVKETTEDEYFILNSKYKDYEEVSKFMKNMFILDYQNGKSFATEVIYENVQAEDIYFPTEELATATVIDFSQAGKLNIFSTVYETTAEGKIRGKNLFSKEMTRYMEMKEKTA